MVQRKPQDKPTLEQVLKLVNELTPGEQDQVVEELKLQWLHRAIRKGVDEADRGELIDADVAFAELEQRYQTSGEQT